MKKELCVKLVIYEDYTEMHGQQNNYKRFLIPNALNITH